MIALNMKMPEKCAECRFNIYETCTATKDRRATICMLEKRPYWCPLLEAMKFGAAHIVDEAMLREAARIEDQPNMLGFMEKHVRAQLLEKLKGAFKHPGAVLYATRKEEGVCGDAMVYKAYVDIVLQPEGQDQTEEEHPCEN